MGFTVDQRNAERADLRAITELLRNDGLPTDDIECHLENFIILVNDGEIIGVGGLERCGEFGLVRSIAVTPENRNKGVARRIYRCIEERAHALGISTLYLLTESAADYFDKLGFVILERAQTPPSVMASRQFEELCPSTATVMFRQI